MISVFGLTGDWEVAYTLVAVTELVTTTVGMLVIVVTVVVVPHTGDASIQ